MSTSSFIKSFIKMKYSTSTQNLLFQSKLVVLNKTENFHRCISYFLQNSHTKLYPDYLNIHLTRRLLIDKLHSFHFKSCINYSQFSKDIISDVPTVSKHVQNIETRQAVADIATDQDENESNDEMRGVLSLDEIYQFLIQENARDIVVMRLSKSINYVEYFIVVTANSTRHLAFMAESLNRVYKARKTPNDPFLIVEGKRTAKDWQCIDFGNAVVHFMLEEVREKYQLEKLWLLGPQFDDLTHETPTLKELLEKVSDQRLFMLSDPGDSAEFTDDVEIVNPWEIEYKNEELNSKPDEDEDAYII